MNTIFIRSPFFITVNEVGQVGSKVELFIWNNPDTIPTDPTYTLKKNIASTTQTENTYNISNYCKEFIKHIFPEYSDETPKPEDFNNYCNVTVKRYKLVGTTYSLLDTTDYIAVEGYTSYLGGVNQYSISDVVPLFNSDIVLNLQENQLIYVNALFNVGSYTWSTSLNDYDFDVLDSPKIMMLPLYYDINNNINEILWGANSTKVYLNEICEPKYTPLVCSFVNRFGGWSFINFFKAQVNSIEVKGSEYNHYSDTINYNVYEGQRKTFNLNGNQKVKLNTGWIPQNYSELIQDLLLSETILLDNKPAKLTTKSTNLKTSLQDKNINYEMEFEYAYSLINNNI